MKYKNFTQSNWSTDFLNSVYHTERLFITYVWWIIRLSVPLKSSKWQQQHKHGEEVQFLTIQSPHEVTVVMKWCNRNQSGLQWAETRPSRAISYTCQHSHSPNSTWIKINLPGVVLMREPLHASQISSLYQAVNILLNAVKWDTRLESLWVWAWSCSQRHMAHKGKAFFCFASFFSPGVSLCGNTATPGDISRACRTSRPMTAGMGCHLCSTMAEHKLNKDDPDLWAKASPAHSKPDSDRCIQKKTCLR